SKSITTIVGLSTEPLPRERQSCESCSLNATCKLRKNGVKVLSATEQIGDTDEGYLVEGLLEMFAEQYSTKLSKRVKNGLYETRAKGNFAGGNILLGFKAVPTIMVNGRGREKKIVIDEEKAPIIRYAFEAYANGVSKKKIIEEINLRGWRTNKGEKFSINSLGHALRNRKFIGEYYFNDEKIEGYPVLINPELFEKVQTMLDKHKLAPATQKAKIEYLLYGKTYCGNCGANLIGVSGTSKTGDSHHYYSCATKYKKHTCTKKTELKEKLEIFIVENVRDYVTIRTSAEKIADLVLAEYKKNINFETAKELERKIVSIDKQINNIANLMIDSVTNLQIIKKLNEKANDLSLEKKAFDAELAKIKLAIKIPHTKKDIVAYLAMFAKGCVKDIEYRKRIIDRLVNTIFIYDDKI
ncbi:MAG: recombinase family protein, partial [Clostridia bacterium]